MQEHFKNDLVKISETPHLSPIFESILRKKEIFIEDEDIMDFLFIERTGFEIMGGQIQKNVNWQPAILIIATNCGIIFIEEGGYKITDTMYGYRIKHIQYE